MANRLINEQSPYLLQHAHNPVDWYPWGDEPFERAKREHKPVLVSIGYAACHWCHVMERESFEREEVAAYMNEHFINIKVDREEHPDVDHMYMDAVQAISGSGGWPLNVFVTPDRAPFYGGTYYPPSPMYNRVSWMQLLERLNEVWIKQQDEVAAQSQQMLQYLKQASAIGSAAAGDKFGEEACKQVAQSLLQQADTVHGGFGRAPKFPGTMAISYLLDHYSFTKEEASLKHALHSLDAMIDGGIYDQVGGGFARYSTDDQWLAPHFEKMLYDNALIILSLCDAYSITKNARYLRVINETIAFAERELKDETGGYYSALDADSEGVEGKFYTWTWEEWTELFGDEVSELTQYFGIQKEGNWEHTNILHVAKNTTDIAAETGLDERDVFDRINAAKQKIFEARKSRQRPLTDDKSLLSWNALMNLALTKAAAVSGNENYRQRATEHMQWMLERFMIEDELYHVWKQGQARISAKLDDYAYLIQAMLQLASVAGDNDWILKAVALTEVVQKNFVHDHGDFFYYTAARHNDIPVRKVDMYDGATPSANAYMAHNLLLLGMVMERHDWMEQGDAMLGKMSGNVVRYGYSFAKWAQLLQWRSAGLRTVLCTGSESILNRQELQTHHLPHVYILTLTKEISDVPLLSNKILADESLIFVCTDIACLPPKRTVDSTLQLLSL